MAARDSFGVFAEPGLSQLQRAIRNACDPRNIEPNLALNLEVADLINSKKSNTPRDASVEIVHLINSRNQNVALLALAVRPEYHRGAEMTAWRRGIFASRTAVINSTSRSVPKISSMNWCEGSPERPAVRTSRVQHRILESIEEWRQTICQTSRYKEDLGFIRDMHRLLLQQGYSFPQVRREDAAVLNPSDNLRSAEEMEEEEREAQSAKLQELIRRNTPADLQEANQLMKILAGYDNRSKPDYRAKAAEEVSMVQAKARLLEDMLQNQQPGQGIPEGEVFHELGEALMNAKSKIAKMCDAESTDPEARKLVEIYDSIVRTIERYNLVIVGDLDAASRIPKGTLGTTTGVSKNANNELSLIDFDPEPSSNGNAPEASLQAHGGNALENDLLGLSLGEEGPLPGGFISLGGSNSKFYPYCTEENVIINLFSVGFPPMSSGPSPPAMSATAMQQNLAAFQLNHDILSSMNLSRPASQSSTPVPGKSPMVRSTATPPQAADPFASLVSASPRPASAASSAFQPPQSQPAPASSSLLDLIGGPSVPAQPAGRAAEDDDWNFASSLPQSNTLPANNQVQVLNSQLRVEFQVRRVPNAPRQIYIRAVFSNTTSQPIGELHFQVAVEKSYTLQLRPQSGRDIAPLQQNGVQQDMLLDGIDSGKGNSVKLRFKVSYKLGAETREEQGMVPSLGVY
ncbi:uncharacterized protein N7483_002049 [Penicillium malachiteum]|uniref:uncharacterized protein n=1 Tax=Penicillium malachiteum TaxID=1324776 RepID=UPI002547060D|nr:uncharacterized protein N7483_002049 [Penicillium malachiteum]KAJ5736924.1 hypothetical protein N7483_002049 [Penicillium malachiteum]